MTLPEEIEWNMESAILAPNNWSPGLAAEWARKYWGIAESDPVQVSEPMRFRKRPSHGGEYDIWIDEVPEGANTRGSFLARLVQ